VTLVSQNNRQRVIIVRGARVLALCLCLEFAAPAIADETANDSSRLADVVITAQKKSERSQDVPIPLSVLSTTDLTTNNQVLLKDYYTTVPGLSVSPNIEFSQMISIRGITTGGFSNPTVGVMIDEVPYGFLSGNLVPDVDPGDLARIEVLRGPQGTLYGADSMGGLLKFVTIDPSTEAFSGRFQAGTSAIHNGNKPGFNIRGSLNIPLTDELAVRVSGYQRQDPGYINNPTLNRQGVNEEQSNGARISAMWRPSDDISLKLAALYQHTAGGLSEVNTLATLNQDYVANSSLYTKTVLAYSAVFKAQLRSAELTSVTGYNTDRTLGGFDFTPFFAQNTQDLYGVTGTPLYARSVSPVFTQEVRVATPLGSHIDWLAGAFYTHEYSSDSTYSVYATDPETGRILGQTWLNVYPSTFLEYAAFTDVTFRFTDRFDIQLGGRESHAESSLYAIATGPFDEVFYSAPSPVISPLERSKFNTFTYLATPRLKLTPDLMVYARFASGYRPGGPNIGTPDAPTSYAPDKTRNYEAGVKGEFLNHTLSVDASLFYIDWKDIQLQLFSPSGLGYSANGAAAKSEGIELSVESHPFAGLDISGWISYDHAVLTEDFPINSTVYGASGDRLPNTARFSANVSVQQDFPLPWGATGFFGATVSYVGDRQGIFTGVPGEPAPRQDFPSYTKTDLRAGVNYDTWSFDLFLNNATDARGLLNGGIGYIEPSAYVYIVPRAVGMNVTKKF